MNTETDKNKSEPNKQQEAHAPALHMRLDAPSLASASSDIQSNEKNTFVSAGEKVHRWGTYLSVDWIFNAISGVSLSYLGKQTKLGQKYWSGPITRGFEKALSPLIKNPENLAKSAESGNIFVSIIAGGMLTIPPLMILESKSVKKSIVQRWDKIIYGKEKVENDPKFQQSYDEIDNAPDKSFASGMTSRFAALAPLLALVLIPQTKKQIDKYLFNHIENASAATMTKAGFGKEKLFGKLPVDEAQSKWKFIHENAAMDLGLGIPYAILHSMFYNMFSKNSHDKKEGAIEEKPPTSSQNVQTTPQEQQPSADKKWTDTVERKDAPITSQSQTNSYAKKIEQKNIMEQLAL